MSRLMVISKLCAENKSSVCDGFLSLVAGIGVASVA